MLAMSALMVPDMAPAWFELPSALKVIWSPSFFTSTFGLAGCAMLPSGPLIEMLPEAMVSSTPFGSGTGYLAMRDMAYPLSDDAEHFAAETVGARLAIGHHAARGRQDRDAQAVHHARDVVASHVDAQARLRDALDALDHRTAGVVLERNGELFLRAGLAAFVADGEVLDVALVLQHPGDRAFQLRRGHRDFGVADDLRIANARQHVGDRVVHAHMASHTLISTNSP